jgi:chromosome segregation protein
VIHSATVETLISQTEDLSARLKVQIRRNAVLERRALELEEKTKDIEKQMFTLQEQVEVFKEKDATHGDKVRDLQTALDSHKKELELLETRYSELSNLSQRREEDAALTAKDLKAQIQELEKYVPLENENFKLGEENNYLKGKLEELVTYLQKKEEEAKDLRQQISAQREGLSSQEQLIQTLKAQVEYNHKAAEGKAELENMLVHKDREHQQQTAHITQELMGLRQEIKNHQMMSKGLHSEKTQLEQQLRSCEETITGLSKDNSELERQIENLQNLWYKLQSEYEKEKTKTTALTKLNRELSVELQRSKSSPAYEEDFLKKYVTQGRNIDV